MTIVSTITSQLQVISDDFIKCEKELLTEIRTKIIKLTRSRQERCGNIEFIYSSPNKEIPAIITLILFTKELKFNYINADIIANADLYAGLDAHEWCKNRRDILELAYEEALVYTPSYGELKEPHESNWIDKIKKWFK